MHFVVDKHIREYVLDQLEAEKKLLLFAHHQEMLDAVEQAVRSKVSRQLSHVAFIFNSVKLVQMQYNHNKPQSRFARMWLVAFV